MAEKSEEANKICVPNPQDMDPGIAPKREPYTLDIGGDKTITIDPNEDIDPGMTPKREPHTFDIGGGKTITIGPNEDTDPGMTPKRDNGIYCDPKSGSPLTIAPKEFKKLGISTDGMSGLIPGDQGGHNALGAKPQAGKGHTP